MHELGIVFHVIKTIEQVGEEQHLQNVASVTLEIGQVSGVIPHELESCWDWAVKRTELMPIATAADRSMPPCRRAAFVLIAAVNIHGCCGAVRSVSKRSRRDNGTV